MNLSLKPLLRSIIQNDSSFKSKIQALGPTYFNIDNGILKLGIEVSENEGRICSPFENPDFILDIKPKSMMRIATLNKSLSSFVSGDIEKFISFVSIISEFKVDCSVAIYDIFGNKAAFIFESILSAYPMLTAENTKDRLAPIKMRIRATQLKLDRIEKIINSNDYAVR